MLEGWRFRMRALLRRGAVERELEQEMAHHRAVHGAQGEEEAVKEACREARGAAWLWALGRDLRLGTRSLRQAPGFALPAILTLSLGLGAAIAIFAVVSAVLWQPLPFARDGQLLVVRERIALLGPVPIRVSAPDIAYIRADGAAFSGVAAYTSDQEVLGGGSTPERVPVTQMSAATTGLLAAKPLLGRGFEAAEDRPGSDVALLSEGLWRSRFGGDRGIVGRVIDLQGRPRTVVGVMPASFAFPPRGLDLDEPPAAIYVPLGLTPAVLADVADNFDYRVLARLRPGATLAQAGAEMAAAAPQIQHSWESKVGKVPGLKLELVADQLRELIAAPLRPLMELLLGAAALLLALSGANAANLFLVRATTRRREWALCTALGAGRGRLARRMLVEAELVALAATALGVGWAWLSLRGLAVAAPPSLPQVQGLRLSGATWWVALGLGLVLGPLCGALAARVAAAPEIELALRQGSAALAGGHARWRSGLVMGQVALAFVLACGAGLMVRSLQQAADGGAGVDANGRVHTALYLPEPSYAAPGRVAGLWDRLAAQLSQEPGIAAAAAATDTPTQTDWDRIFSVRGQPAPAGATLPETAHALTLGPYFRTLGIPMFQGREFSAAEQQGKANVLIVSAALAARFWPHESALGHQIKWGPADSTDPWLTVIGVVGNVKDTGLDTKAGLYTYAPYQQECTAAHPNALCRTLYVTVDSSLPLTETAATLRRAIHQDDGTLPVTAVRPLQAVLYDSLIPRRFNTLLVAFFGAAALLLAAVGLYGVLAYVVSGQRREIGVRMALGAGAPRVLGATLARGLGWVAWGLGVGLVAAVLLQGTVKSLLYAVPTGDPLTWTAVALLLLAVAAMACLVPAWRASRVSPLQVLREM